MCTKFQINQIILTLFSEAWDKNPTPAAEKVVKCRRQYGEGNARVNIVNIHLKLDFFISLNTSETINLSLNFKMELGIGELMLNCVYISLPAENKIIQR